MAYFTLDGARYEVPTSLTYGEQIDIYKTFGEDAAALGVIWIAVRRQHPSTTVDDLRAATVEVVEEDEDKLPPTNAAAFKSAGENGTATEHENTGILGSAITTE